MPRFVILQHQLPDSEHWDLMLEHGDVLLTWQLLYDPTAPDGIPAPAHRIGNHRMAYLDYEGPVSRDRGRVRRVDSGGLTIREMGPDLLRIELGGVHLKGYFGLRRTSADDWILAPEAARGPACT